MYSSFLLYMLALHVLLFIFLFVFYLLFFFVFFFFFQAEDGIRDVAVTGVQTCALPILMDSWYGGQQSVFDWWNETRGKTLGVKLNVKTYDMRYDASQVARTWPQIRSEERRVGKECRSRGAR